MRIAIATCRPLPEPDVDEALLLEAMEKHGIQGEMTAWDEPKVDWSLFDACVVRSTWNYLDDPNGFASWMSSTSAKTILLNPAAAMQPNIHKRYLLDLESVGVEIVPTVIFEQGSTPSVHCFPGRPIVVKPAISAGSYLTEMFDCGERALATQFLHEHLKDQDMMVQPYLESVEEGDEIAWCWIDGEVTHGVRKSPRFHEGCESVSEAVFPSQTDTDIIKRVMAKAPPGLLYARIDVMREGERWLLSELELIEPSLFFKQNPSALDKFVLALKDRVSSAS